MMSGYLFLFMTLVSLGSSQSQPDQVVFDLNNGEFPLSTNAIPERYGSVPGKTVVSFAPGMNVYDFGESNALAHFFDVFQNDWVLIRAEQFYRVTLQSIENFSWTVPVAPASFNVTCGADTRSLSKNAWRVVSAKRQFDITQCSGDVVSVAWGTSGSLGINNLRYTVVAVNSCGVNNGGCGPGTCEIGSSPGQVHCTCDSGYYDWDNTCIDIDECVDGTNECSPAPRGTCVNSEGSYTCGCELGWHLDVDGKTCVDDDECLVEDRCGPNAVCNNLDGSWSCTCDLGYSGGAQGPCTSNAKCGDGCPDHSNCRPVDGQPGQYSCQCVTGYSGSPCTDINECASVPGYCSVYATCTNGQGQPASCVCNSGFTGTGVICTDINECSNPSFCGSTQNNVCLNIPLGSYTCACVNGYHKNENDICVDTNECETAGACGAQAVCQNLVGSYRCSCNSGFQQAVGSNQTSDCLNIDECALGWCPSTNCTDTEGSYVCCGKLGDSSGCPRSFVQTEPTGPNGTVIGIGVGSSLLGLLVCIGLIFLLLLCRKRWQRQKYIQRRLRHQQMEEAAENEIEMSPRETSGDMLEEGLHDKQATQEFEYDPRDPQQHFQDVTAVENVQAARNSRHVHNSSSSAAIPAADEQPRGGGTREGGEFLGVAPVLDAEVDENAIGPDGDYVLVLEPRNASVAAPTDSAILIAPKIRVIQPDDRLTQEMKVQRAPLSATHAAASVLAISAIGGGASVRPRPSQPLPVLQTPAGASHSPSSSRQQMAASPHGGPVVPPSPKKSLLVIQDVQSPPADYDDEPEDTDGPIPERFLQHSKQAAASAQPQAQQQKVAAPAAANKPSPSHSQNQNGPASTQSDVPEDPYGEHSVNSKHSNSGSRHNTLNGLRMDKLGDGGVGTADADADEHGEPSIHDEYDMQENDAPQAAPLEYDDDDVEPTQAQTEKQKKEMAKRQKEAEKRKHAEMEKRKKALKIEEEKRKKEIKAEEDRVKREKHWEEQKAKKEKKAAEKAEAERRKKEKNAHKDLEKDVAIRSAFSRLRKEALAAQDGVDLEAPAETNSAEPNEGDGNTQSESVSTTQQPVSHAPKDPSPHDGPAYAVYEGRQTEPGVGGISTPPSPRGVIRAHHTPSHPHISHAFNFPPEQIAHAAQLSISALHAPGSASLKTPANHGGSASAHNTLNISALAVGANGPRASASSVAPGAPPPASGSPHHAKKNSHSHNGVNIAEYVSPSSLLHAGGRQSSHSVSTNSAPSEGRNGVISEAMASAAASALPSNGPPPFLRMTSEGMPRTVQRHSDSAQTIRSLTLRDVLTGRNPRCFQAFSEFMKAEHSDTLLKFYMVIEEYRHQKAEMEQKALNEDPLEIAVDLADKANEIFKSFLNSQDHKSYVALPEDVATRLAQRSNKYHRTGIVDAVLLPADDGVGFAVAAFVSTVFDEAQEVVFKMMEADAWFRFMKTDRAKEFDN